MINDLKKDFGINEESNKALGNQVSDLDTDSHQTKVKSQGSKITLNATEESKIQKWDTLKQIKLICNLFKEKH